jgi:iron-sulfur cluster repair protein YtfE (RIC family)
MPKANPITMLKQDHQKVKELLSQLTETTERATKKRQQLVSQIASELRVHMQLEEEIFYPTFKEAQGDREGDKLYYEATEEHYAAKTVLADLLQTDASTPNFAGKAKVLKELVEHHIKEEEKELFPQAKEAMDAEQLQALALKMQQRKTALTSRKAALSSRKTSREQASPPMA